MIDTCDTIGRMIQSVCLKCTKETSLKWNKYVKVLKVT